MAISSQSGQIRAEAQEPEAHLSGLTGSSSLKLAAPAAVRNFALGFMVFSILVLLMAMAQDSYRQQVSVTISTWLSAVQCTCVKDYLLSPWLYCSLLIALVWERLAPARKEEGEGSLSFYAGFDFLWSLPKLFFFAAFWPIFTLALQALYNQYLGFLTIHSFDSSPWLFRVSLGLMVADLAHWASHLIRHRIAIFWHFHSIHHSQRHLNFFTEYRSHIVDDMLKLVLEALPLFMLQQGFFEVLLVNQLRYWYSTIYHSNIKSNFGFLRYLLVTPQSHRIHHSIEPRHMDKNFGLTLSIWDHIFGTQYKNYDEYPETGVTSRSYNLESPAVDLGSSVTGLGSSAIKEIKPTLATFFEQFFFPFQFSYLKPVASGKAQFFPALTSIRFFLALAVVFIHYDGLILPGFLPGAIKSGVMTNIVPAFFCLTGFLLAARYRKFKGCTSFYQYFCSRIARIFPLYWFACLLAIAIGPLSYLCPDGQKLPELILYNFSLLQAWSKDPIIYYGFCPPAYSLSMEVFFYLLFPALVFVRNRVLFSILICAQLFLEFHLYSIAPVDTRGYVMGGKPFSHVSDFLLGMIFFAFFNRASSSVCKKESVALFTALELLCVVSFLVWPHLRFSLLPGTVPLRGPLALLIARAGSMLIFGFFCCLLAWRKGAIARLLAWPFFVYLGELSYSFFLLHQILLRGLVFHAIDLKSLGLWGFPAFCVVATMLSVLTFKFIEAPWRQTLLKLSKNLEQAGRFSLSIIYSQFRDNGKTTLGLFMPVIVLGGGWLIVSGNALFTALHHDQNMATQKAIYAEQTLKVTTEPGWFLLPGSENVLFGNCVCLKKIMARRTNHNSLVLVADWLASREPAVAKFVGVHLLNAKQEIVHQLDHPLLPAQLFVTPGCAWQDKIEISARQLKNSKRLGLAVFEDPQATFLIRGGKCDWGNHRLLIDLPKK